MTRIEVVVGDDHPVVREGVVRLLDAAGDMSVVAEAGSGSDVLDLVHVHRPQVAVVDFRMPGLDGIAVAAAVRRDGLETAVLILSAHTEIAIMSRAIDQGAAGFLSKEAGRAEILRAVRVVAAGGRVVPVELSDTTAGHVGAHRDRGTVALSARERQVLTAMAEGKSVPVMAAEMFVAPSTVKTHVTRLYEKLGVAERGAAVAEAMRRGVLR